jgi:hypothetical protein
MADFGCYSHDSSFVVYENDVAPTPPLPPDEAEVVAFGALALLACPKTGVTPLGPSSRRAGAPSARVPGIASATESFCSRPWWTWATSPTRPRARASLGTLTPRQSATVVSVAASGAENLSREGLDPGLVIPPLRDSIVVYSATSQGPPVIQALYLYEFDLQDCQQSVIGSRGIVLTSRPLAAGYGESRVWETGVFVSDSGKEVRRSRYDDFGPPKRLVRLPLATVSQAEQNLLQNALRFGGRYALQVPLWMSFSRLTSDTTGSTTILCPTADREFLPGMSAMVLKASRASAASVDSGFAVRLIEEVHADGLVLSSAVNGFAAGDFVLPMIPTATPRGLNLQSLDLRRTKGTAEFEELAQAAAAAEIPNEADQYEGFDVWEIQPRDAIEIEPEVHWSILGESWQAQNAYSPREANYKLKFRLIAKTRAEVRALRDWFDRHRGREGAFWVRSHKPDLQLTAAASSGSNILEIRDSLDAFGLRNIPRHVWSPDLGAAMEIGNPRNSGTADAALVDIIPDLPGDLAVGARLENFFLVRFAADRLDMEAGGQARYWRDGAGEDQLVVDVGVDLVELPKETPTGF